MVRAALSAACLTAAALLLLLPVGCSARSLFGATQGYVVPGCSKELAGPNATWSLAITFADETSCASFNAAAMWFGSAGVLYIPLCGLRTFCFFGTADASLTTQMPGGMPPTSESNPATSSLSVQSIMWGSLASPSTAPPEVVVNGLFGNTMAGANGCWATGVWNTSVALGTLGDGCTITNVPCPSASNWVRSLNIAGTCGSIEPSYPSMFASITVAGGFSGVNVSQPVCEARSGSTACEAGSGECQYCTATGSCTMAGSTCAGSCGAIDTLTQRGIWECFTSTDCKYCEATATCAVKNIVCSPTCGSLSASACKTAMACVWCDVESECKPRDANACRPPVNGTDCQDAADEATCAASGPCVWCAEASATRCRPLSSSACESPTAAVTVQDVQCTALNATQCGEYLSVCHYCSKLQYCVSVAHPCVDDCAILGNGNSGTGISCSSTGECLFQSIGNGYSGVDGFCFPKSRYTVVQNDVSSCTYVPLAYESWPDEPAGPPSPSSNWTVSPAAFKPDEAFWACTLATCKFCPSQDLCTNRDTMCDDAPVPTPAPTYTPSIAFAIVNTSSAYSEGASGLAALIYANLYTSINPNDVNVVQRQPDLPWGGPPDVQQVSIVFSGPLGQAAGTEFASDGQPEWSVYGVLRFSMSGWSPSPTIAVVLSVNTSAAFRGGESRSEFLDDLRRGLTVPGLESTQLNVSFTDDVDGWDAKNATEVTVTFEGFYARDAFQHLAHLSAAERAQLGIVRVGPAAPTSSGGKGGMSMVVYIGIGAGGFILLIVIACVVRRCCCRRRYDDDDGYIYFADDNDTDTTSLSTNRPSPRPAAGITTGIKKPKSDYQGAQNTEQRFTVGGGAIVEE